jgi:hypothetical protein
MQNGTWLRAQHLRRLAVQHDEAATGLETPQSDEQRASGEEKRRR